jgi:hypothetical protein
MMLVVLFFLASNAVAREQSFVANLKPAENLLQSFDNSLVTRCFGSSHASTALRADWRKQLTQVSKDLGTEFVRFHGLFDDDMSAVVKGNGKATKADMRKQKDATEQKGACTFKENQDFSDPGAGLFNATTKEECCELCYTRSTGLPQPCVAAVWGPWDGGTCYFKLGSNFPVQKNGTGIWSCITDRPSPRSYSFSWVNIFSVFDFLRSINMR